MDFQELLNHADYNIAETKHTGTAKRYSTVLPPPKKVPKANVQSDNIKRFLEKKKAEEAARAAAAQKQKEKLLALRAQNSKNNKKAKIMASRTKDNDFSRIKLTEDELEAKKKREAALIKKNLADKVERMKARIEMEEKEKLMPKKRKRKSKNTESVESTGDHLDELQDECKEINDNKRGSESNISRKENVHKPKPPPPAVSFHDLLKIAEKKQFEPLEMPVKKKEDEKLMTKKERKLREEEIARQKRKQERLLRGDTGNTAKPNSLQSSSSSSSMNTKNISEKGEKKKPVVIHVGKDLSRTEQNVTKFKVPKTTNVSVNKNAPIKCKDIDSNSLSSVKSVKNSMVNGQRKRSKINGENGSSFKDVGIKDKVIVQKKNALKPNSADTTSAKIPTLDEAALKATLEKEIREKLEKEIEEKLAAKFAEFQNLQSNKTSENVSEASAQINKQPGTGNNTIKKPIGKPLVNSRQDVERLLAMKKQALIQKNLKPKLPEKKPFHKNPYLDPPRRLLEPHRPPRPPMRRTIESDDEDDDDDDDMKDFIDDCPSQNEENYSKYIKEIFNYDKSKYLDDDDDEVMETSFAEQLSEEVRSARLGYLEDLEEEKLELARKRKKKTKK